MIFIFDWGNETERIFGPLHVSDVEFETQFDSFVLLCRRRWFRAFFVPIIPTSTVGAIRCHDSGREENISQKDLLKYRDLAKLNQLYVNGEILDDEYSEKRRKLGV